MIKRYGIEGELIYQKDDGHIVRYEDYEILHQKFDGVSSLCEEAMRINCEWERAMMAAIGEDGIGSVTKAIEQLKAGKHELQQKLDAMAAENSALMKFCKNAAFDADYESELGMERGGFADAVNDIKTPVTDAYLNSVRAEGVERFISESAYEIPHRIKCGLMHYAKRLRSGTHDTADKAG